MGANNTTDRLNRVQDGIPVSVEAGADEGSSHSQTPLVHAVSSQETPAEAETDQEITTQLDPGKIWFDEQNRVMNMDWGRNVAGDEPVSSQETPVEAETGPETTEQPQDNTVEATRGLELISAMDFLLDDLETDLVRQPNAVSSEIQGDTILQNPIEQQVADSREDNIENRAEDSTSEEASGLADNLITVIAQPIPPIPLSRRQVEESQGATQGYVRDEVEKIEAKEELKRVSDAVSKLLLVVIFPTPKPPLLDFGKERELNNSLSTFSRRLSNLSAVLSLALATEDVKRKALLDTEEAYQNFQKKWESFPFTDQKQEFGLMLGPVLRDVDTLLNRLQGRVAPVSAVTAAPQQANAQSRSEVRDTQQLPVENKPNQNLEKFAEQILGKMPNFVESSALNQSFNNCLTDLRRSLINQDFLNAELFCKQALKDVEAISNDQKNEIKLNLEDVQRELTHFKREAAPAAAVRASIKQSQEVQGKLSRFKLKAEPDSAITQELEQAPETLRLNGENELSFQRTLGLVMGKILENPNDSATDIARQLPNLSFLMAYPELMPAIFAWVKSLKEVEKQVLSRNTLTVAGILCMGTAKEEDQARLAQALKSHLEKQCPDLARDIYYLPQERQLQELKKQLKELEALKPLLGLAKSITAIKKFFVKVWENFKKFGCKIGSGASMAFHFIWTKLKAAGNWIKKNPGKSFGIAVLVLLGVAVIAATAGGAIPAIAGAVAGSTFFATTTGSLVAGGILGVGATSIVGGAVYGAVTLARRSSGNARRPQYVLYPNENGAPSSYTLKNLHPISSVQAASTKKVQADAVHSPANASSNNGTQQPVRQVVPGERTWDKGMHFFGVKNTANAGNMPGESNAHYTERGRNGSYDVAAKDALERNELFLPANDTSGNAPKKNNFEASGQEDDDTASVCSFSSCGSQ